MRETVMDEVRQTFNPEFVNRINEIIVFHPLGEDEMTEILKLMLGQVRSKVETQGFKIEFTPESEKFLVKNGFDANSGARPLHRTIQRMVEDVLAEDILRKKFKAGATIYVEVDSSGEKLLFSNERSAQV